MNKPVEKSKRILETLQSNVNSFRALLNTVSDELTKQNIRRAIILFSCSGIDAVVKQLIIDTLELVIERDEGAQEQLRVFTERRLKKTLIDQDYSILSRLFTVKNSRKLLINMLKKELSYDSLQSSDQLFRVAAAFNIMTDRLVTGDEKKNLKKAFDIRNKIIHQMDVDFEQRDMEYFTHDDSEVEEIFMTIESVAMHFIDEVGLILKKEVTVEYLPPVSIEGETLIFRDF